MPHRGQGPPTHGCAAPGFIPVLMLSWSRGSHCGTETMLSRELGLIYSKALEGKKKKKKSRKERKETPSAISAQPRTHIPAAATCHPPSPSLPAPSRATEEPPSRAMGSCPSRPAPIVLPFLPAPLSPPPPPRGRGENRKRSPARCCGNETSGLERRRGRQEEADGIFGTDGEFLGLSLRRRGPGVLTKQRPAGARPAAGDASSSPAPPLVPGSAEGCWWQGGDTHPVCWVAPASRQWSQKGPDALLQGGDGRPPG